MTSARQKPEPQAHWKSVSVRYPYTQAAVVGPVELRIGRGERVLLLGPSGCGKSSLLLTLTGLIPKSIPAEVSGNIRIGGIAAEAREPAEWADTVAQFFQDADQTLCGMRVAEEIAFALENRGLPEAEIERRVGEAMCLVGLPETWRERRTMTLSGGEKQLVALAATLVQGAEFFVADEPTAHLAPEAASRLHALLLEQAGRTVLIVDHRLDGLISSVDRLVVLGEEGMIIADGPPARIFRERQKELTARGIWCPLAIHLDAALTTAGLAPDEPRLSIAALLDHFSALDGRQKEKAREITAHFVAGRSTPSPSGAPSVPAAPLVRLVSADCAPFLGPVVLKDMNVELHAGEVLGILGRNGAGKSTLAAALAGMLRLKRGRREGPAGAIAFQRPETQFTEASALDEIAAALPRDLTRQEAQRQAGEILAAWGLERFSARHPFELSQGQKRRLALAVLTASDRWPLLILDEPLAGLDARWAEKVEADIERLRAAGRALAIVTHDMDFALRICPRSVILGDGGMLARGPTAGLLADTALIARAGLAEPVLAPALRWLERHPERC